MGECPQQPLLPLFLVTGGLAGIVKNVLLITENIIKQKSSTLISRVRHPKIIICMWRIGNFFFNLVLLAWLVTGSYWVYKMYREVVATDYATCNEVLYKFTFSFVTCSFVIMLMIFSCTFFMAGSSLRKRKTHRTISPQAGSQTVRASGEITELADNTRGEVNREVENMMSVEYGERDYEGVAGDDVVGSGMETAESQEGGGASGDGGGGGTDWEEVDSFPLAAITGSVPARMDMEDQAVSTGNLTNPTSHHSRPSELRWGTHNSELRLPNVQQQQQQQYHSPRMTRSLMRFESCPCPNYPLRHASLGSNDFGLLPNTNQSAYASRYKQMAGPVSFSQFLSHTQKNRNSPHSSFRSLCEAYDVDPRCSSLQLPRNSSFREQGTESNRSSLYNTVHSDGFSITAV